jgi:hypothetical protein
VETHRAVRYRGSCIFQDNPLTDGDEVISLMSRPSLPSGRFLELISLTGWVKPRARVQLEGSDKLKKKIQLTHRKPCFNQLRCCVPLSFCMWIIIFNNCLYFEIYVCAVVYSGSHGMYKKLGKKCLKELSRVKTYTENCNSVTGICKQ